MLCCGSDLHSFSRELDPGLEESISSLIWAAPRLQTDVQEMKAISDQLTAKYGKEFGQACRTNALNNVSEKVMHKLGVQAPPKILVERYMMEIAKSYNVPFEPDPSIMVQDEIFAAENLLIDLDETKKGGGCGGGGGGNLMEPQQPMVYPPQPQVCILTLICLVDSPIIIKWMSPFPILWVSGVFFYFIFHRNSCRQTL